MKDLSDSVDPTPGIYLDDSIAVLDFRLLYPSCIIEKNCLAMKLLSPDTKYIERLKDQKLKSMIYTM